MATGVRPGSIKNKNGEYKWWFVLWRLPNVFFETRANFLGGEPDKVISGLALARAFFGVGALVFIAYRYPGYIGGAQELVQTTGRLLPGVGTGLKFGNVWVTSIVYSIILSAMWIAVFALLIVPVTRLRAMPALLLHLCWPAVTIALFAGQFFLAVKLIGWAAPRVSNGSNPDWGEKLGLFVSCVVVYIWFFKAAFLAATDVFRGDDAHPLMAPFVATGVSWTLAYSALSSTGPSGVPHGIWLLFTLAGPLSVTVISVFACLRIRDKHDGQLLFLDGPPPGSRYRAVAVRGASGLSRREFVRLAVPSAVVIGTAAWLAPKALALAGTRSNQAMAFMGGAPYSNTLPGGAFVNSVMFSPDGRTLAAGITNGAVLLWDVTDPARPTAPARPLSGQDGVGPVAFSPDGRILASGSDGSGANEGPAIGNIQLWDVTDPASPAALGPTITTSGEVSSLAFSPDGRTLASGSDGTYGIYGAGTIQLWDVANPARPAALGRSSTDAQGLSSLAFSPRGHVLASGDLSGVVQLWNVANPAHPTALARFRTNPDGSASVAFSPDGRTLASGDNAGHIQLWNVADPARPTTLGPQLSIAYSVSSLAFSPDGRTLAASSNGGYASAAYTSAGLFDSPGYIRLWDVSDPARPTRPSPYITAGTGSAGFCSVAFSPNGSILASGSDGSGSTGAAGRVQLWNVSNPARPTALSRPLT
jgi:WD40 repeat protein